jgi:ADP-heptose:LPS heptosyltransferase
LEWRDRLSLAELFALMKSATLFVGIDSGPLHLAAIAAAPMIGIFGPVAQECRMPSCENAIGLSANLPCIACHHDAKGPSHWQTGCPQEIECMKALAPATVVDSALSLLYAPRHDRLSR